MFDFAIIPKGKRDIVSQKSALKFENYTHSAIVSRIVYFDPLRKKLLTVLTTNTIFFFVQPVISGVSQSIATKLSHVLKSENI